MKKATVSMIMASSLDGKITLSKHEKVKFTSIEDRKHLMRTRAKYDCIIRGANTVKPAGSPAISDFIKDDKKQPLNVLISNNLNFSFKKIPYFNAKKIKRVIFTTKNASIKRRNKAKKFADLIIVQKDNKNRVNVMKVYETLQKRYKCKKILLEGGGLLNSSFMEKNLVDEIYLTVCPFIFADKTCRAFVEEENFPKNKIKKLKLLGLIKGVNDEIFLHYRVEKKSKINWKKEKYAWRMK